MNLTNKSKIIIGIVSSIVFLFLLTLSIDVKSTFQELLLFKKSLLLFLLINYLLAMLFRAKRWQILLMQDSQIDYLSTFKYLSIGYFFNSILPAKGGELIRAEYLKREVKINRSFSYGTIIIERFLDFAVVMMFLIFSVFLSDTVRTIFSGNYIPLILIFSFICLFIYFLFKVDLTPFITNLLPKNLATLFKEKINSFKSSFDIIKKKKVFGKLLFLTLLIWLCTLFSVFIVIHGLSIEIPYYAYFFIVSAGVLGMVIPSTSANIGVYHAVATGALMIFAVSADKALTFAVIVHAMEFLPNVVMGSYFFYKNLKAY